MKLVILDDEEFFRNAWAELIGDQLEVMAYEDPSVLAEAVLSGEIRLEEVDIVVTDFYFKRNDIVSMNLPSFLQKYGYRGKIWLATSARDACLPEGIIGKIPKEPCSFEDLKKLI